MKASQFMDAQKAFITQGEGRAPVAGICRATNVGDGHHACAVAT